MIRLLADENFRGPILDGLLLREPDLDIVRVQDVGLESQDDPTILEWAAQNDRILLTQDVSTVTRYAYERVRAGKKMPGVIEVPQTMQIGEAVQEILLVALAGENRDFENQVWYVS